LYRAFALVGSLRVMSGFMLYALLFPPAEESWQEYVLRGLEAWLEGKKA